jgi:hypothetical protein
LAYFNYLLVTGTVVMSLRVKPRRHVNYINHRLFPDILYCPRYLLHSVFNQGWCDHICSASAAAPTA